MADLVVSEGYAAVGYEYINIDDCWLEKTRGSNGELVADKKRFSRGMKDLSNYVSYLQNLFPRSLSDYFSCRFTQKDSNSAFTKIMATTRVLVTQEFWDICNKMLIYLLHGMLIS